jgi:hypothetical protein
MVAEAIRWMFGYYAWLAIIVSVIGIIVGAKSDTWSQRWKTIVLFGVIAWIMCGVQMGPYASNQEVAVWGLVWTAWYFAALCVGVPIGVHFREQAHTEANQIPETALLEAVEHVASLPAFASMPWFSKRWAEMPREAKMAWIKANQADIRRFVGSHGDLESTPAAEFVVEIQRIDRQAQLAPSVSAADSSSS